MGLVAAALTRLKGQLEIRHGRALSLRDLAELTGVGHARWSTLLAGSDARFSTLLKIAESQGLRPSQLLALGEQAIAEIEHTGSQCSGGTSIEEDRAESEEQEN